MNLEDKSPNRHESVDGKVYCEQCRCYVSPGEVCICGEIDRRD